MNFIKRLRWAPPSLLKGEEGQTFIFDALRDSLSMSWQDHCDWNTKEPSTTSPAVEMREKTSSSTTRTGLDS